MCTVKKSALKTALIAKYIPERESLQLTFKVSTDAALRMSTGSSFHWEGPALANALSGDRGF